jgi:hypothetical protein
LNIATIMNKDNVLLFDYVMNVSNWMIIYD